MSNAFESGKRKTIPAVLIYAREGGRILMIHRNAPDRPGDYHAGKWNGLGGKCEPDESPLETARREFREEAGLDLLDMRFRSLGTLTFPNFKPAKSEDWVVFVFEAQVSASEAAGVVSKSGEGDLHWVPERDLLNLNLWPGDRHFISHVVSSRPFVGTVWYQGQSVSRHWVQPLG